MKNKLKYITQSCLQQAEMMVNGQENGLKGQFIIAQGNPDLSGVALGWRSGNEIVRAIKFIKEKIYFRTGERILYFPEMMFYNSVRKELFVLFIEYSRTVSSLFTIPQALPGARLGWTFSPKLVYKE